MVPVSPHASVRAPALPKPYSPPVASGNTLAAPAPVTWPTGRAELAAVMETAALHGLSGSAAAVLTALLSWANADGIAWPCAESIARRSRKSRRTVFRALAALEAAGLVARRRPSLPARRRRRESNTYELAPIASLPRVPRAESPRSPRRVTPPHQSSASAPRAEPAPVPAVVPGHSAPGTAGTPSPEASPRFALVAPPSLPSPRSPSSPPARVVAPAEPSLSRVPAAPNQVPPWHPKGPGENQKQNARADAQVREATAPPIEPSSPAAAPTPPEATPTKRLTRAERAARNRAAWAARPRPAATTARVPPTPRRSPGYQAREHQVPDPAPALAALRKWRESHQPELPALGREPDSESAPPAPVFETRRADLAQRGPIALGGLLGAFAWVPLGPHIGDHERSPRPCSSPPGPSRSPASGAPPYPEARSPSLWSPHPRW